MLSHICTHLKDQNAVGLRATEKALAHSPTDPKLLHNRRVFQNRLGKDTNPSHSPLSLPTPYPK